MITWGISANSHNAALAVFNNNNLVFASESERFSRVKNDPNLTWDLTRYAKVRWGVPEKIIWYEKPWLKTLRQLYAGQGWLWGENNVKKYLQRYDLNVPVIYSQHHNSHAAAGYYTSKFNHACVIVIDAIGEFECLTIWEGRGVELKKIYSLNYPNSLGLFYSAMTQRCGLKPNEEEYILMGMSALGDASRLGPTMLSDFFIGSFSDPYRLKKNLHKGCLDWKPNLISQQDIYDIAAATQYVYEIIFEKILEHALTLVNSENLVLMGGCALNCVANPHAYRYFNNVWIMPAPGDNGSAIGSVLAVNKRHIIWPGPFLGVEIKNQATNQEIVDYIKNYKICGLARGAAEFGPRALGNRSLIADPRGPDVKEKVNEIKHREQFRPFAPAILEEHASDYFNIPQGRNSDYMQMIYRCKYPELFPAIVHIDGTSRVQTVAKNSGEFRKLLELWYAETGCPMLLNTSLNIKGEPMINTREDADRWTARYGLPIFS